MTAQLATKAHINPKNQLAEISAVYHPNPNVNLCKITSSLEASKYLRDIFPVQITYGEAMIALYVNRANKTIG